MWTDSTTVLQRINSNEKKPIFIANRVCKILEYTSMDQWIHVATKDNPAHAEKRGKSAEALQLSSWVKSPQFLTQSFPFRTKQRRHKKYQTWRQPSSHYRRYCISGYICQITDNSSSLNISVR